MPDGQANDVGLDFLERAQIAVLGVKHHADGFLQGRAVLDLAEHFRQLREVACGQRLAFAEDGGAEQHGLQLADIAGPVECAQQRKRTVGQREMAQARLFADADEEMAGEGGNVAGPLAQRWQGDPGAGQSGQQALVEMPFRHHVVERQVAGGQDADIDLETVLGADRADDAFIERRRQLALQVGREAVDLVEDERARIAELDGADLPVERAGKRVRLVAEQGAFYRICRDAADIEQAERSLGARGCRMHRAQQHFLADTAFAFDKHVPVAASRLGGACEGSAEFGRGADHRIEIEFGVDLLGQRLELVARRFLAGGGHQRAHEAVGRDRLDQVVRGPGPHRLHREQRAGAGGQHQDRQGGAAGLQFLDQRAGIVARHPLVQDDGGQLHPLARAQRGDGRFAVGHDERAPPVARGEGGHEAALRRLVVDQHQQAGVVLGHNPQNRPGAVQNGLDSAAG